MFGEYSEEVALIILNGAENAVRQSLKALEPSKMRVHEIPIPDMVINRTESNKAINDLAVLLELEQASGDRALIITFPAHATIIAPHPVASSANYPGALNKNLESMGWQQAGFFAAETAQAGPALNGQIAQAPGLELAHQYGQKLADRLSKSIGNSNNPYVSDATIRASRSPILLPDWSFRLPFADLGLRPWLTNYLLGGQTPDAHIHGLAINDLIFIGHGFELSSELGYESRKKAKEKGQTLVLTSFNGEHHFYEVPESSYDQGGYEPSMAFFGPHLGNYLSKLNSYLSEKL